MGLFSAIKSAVQSVTGGAARVNIELPAVAYAGDEVQVRVTCTSTGGEVKSQGVFVDLLGTEKVNIKGGTTNSSGEKQDVSVANNTFSQAFQIAGPLVLGANETREFTGTFRIPSSLQPSYNGVHAQHELVDARQYLGIDAHDFALTEEFGRRAVRLQLALHDRRLGPAVHQQHPSIALGVGDDLRRLPIALREKVLDRPALGRGIRRLRRQQRVVLIDGGDHVLGQPLIAYAVKANPNVNVLRILAELGAGADTVSEGEVRRALAAGVPPERIVFSGVGKTDAEIAFALRTGVAEINVESEPELILHLQEGRMPGWSLAWFLAVEA